jgi:predicted NAD/FAD-binding protein
MQVAVIGTGIAGNAAAWTLSKRYPVTVYDREIRPGGHSHSAPSTMTAHRWRSISASSSTTS